MDKETLERRARKLWNEYLKKKEEASMLCSEMVRVRKESEELRKEAKEIYDQIGQSEPTEPPQQPPQPPLKRVP